MIVGDGSVNSGSLSQITLLQHPIPIPFLSPSPSSIFVQFHPWQMEPLLNATLAILLTYFFTKSCLLDLTPKIVNIQINQIYCYYVYG